MQAPHVCQVRVCPSIWGLWLRAQAGFDFNREQQRGAWSLNTVSPSFSVSWNQSRQVTLLPVQLWKYLRVPTKS